MTEEDLTMMAFYRQFVGRGDLVFDVGANYGKRSKLVMALGANGVAFEPQAECCKYLRYVLGNDKRFRLVQGALGATEHNAEMMVSDISVLTTLSRSWLQEMKKMRFTNVKWQRTEVVHVTTLDKMIGIYGTAKFLKIDVEGYELQVLEGLSQPVPALSIEFTAEIIQSTSTAIDYLANLAEIKGQILFDDSMAFKIPDWAGPEILKQSLKELVSPPSSLHWRSLPKDELTLCLQRNGKTAESLNFRYSH